MAGLEADAPVEIDSKAFDDVKAYQARTAALPPVEGGKAEDDPSLPEACQLSWFEYVRV